MQKHGETIFRILLSRTYNIADARDMRQNVFITAFKMLQKGDYHCDIEGSLLPWLTEIARNHLQHYWRSRYRWQFIAFTIEMEQFAEPSRIGDPYLRMRIGRALKMLSQQYRVIVILHCIKEYTFREIGEMRHITTHTASKDCSDALHRLKEILKTPD